jgi:hypothetical protein
MPLRIPTSPPFIRHSGRTRASASPAPAALTLVAAAYVSESYVELTFDRAIDVSAMDVGAIRVDDGESKGLWYVGSDVPVLIEPTRVRVLLASAGPTEASGVRLTVNAENGIVASDDGAAWIGVTDLSLPFE